MESTTSFFTIATTTTVPTRAAVTSSITITDTTVTTTSSTTNDFGRFQLQYSAQPFVLQRCLGFLTCKERASNEQNGLGEPTYESINIFSIYVQGLAV